MVQLDSSKNIERSQSEKQETHVNNGKSYSGDTMGSIEHIQGLTYGIMSHCLVGLTHKVHRATSLGHMLSHKNLGISLILLLDYGHDIHFKNFNETSVFHAHVIFLVCCIFCPPLATINIYLVHYEHNKKIFCDMTTAFFFQSILGQEHKEKTQLKR